MSDNLRIKRLREHGARLGRPGISGRIHALVDAYVSAPSYYAAIVLAGRLRVLSMAASCDSYWNEKTTNGMVLEAYDIANAERPDDESDDGIRSPSPLTFTAVDSLATQLDDAKQVIVTFRATMEQMRRERDEVQNALDFARATNARLHRRAQGVDARSPDDADLIRRLRADVRGQAKHAGHVIGYVFRLRCALSDAQHATSMAVRERDEARAHAEERTAKVRDLARCAAASEARARAYAAKLARIREVAECDYHDTPRTVLRIIDEKEGGM